jgi:hypothetical protein
MTWVTRPSVPSASSLRTVRKSPSWRRLWKGARSFFCALARVMSARASAELPASGLSTTTCLPALSAAVASSTWVSLGVPTTMRSMAGSAKASAAVATMRAEG